MRTRRLAVFRQEQPPSSHVLNQQLHVVERKILKLSTLLNLNPNFDATDHRMNYIFEISSFLAISKVMFSGRGSYLKMAASDESKVSEISEIKKI